MSRAKYDLTGKVVVITGGSSGIGAATTAEMVRRGARVAVLDVDPNTPETVPARHRNSAIGLVTNVTDRADLDRAMGEVVDRLGRIDVVMANAGILARTSTVRNTPPEAIDTLFAVNVIGVIDTVRAALPHVIAARGQVVLVSSVFAFLNGMGTIPYAMSKAAIEQLGRGLRVELAMHSVSVTTAYFSLIDTPMIRNGIDTDRTAGDVMKVLPPPLLKRLQPEAAARAVVDGVAARRTRVMAPARWIPLSVARGIINPLLDTHLTKNAALRALLTELDNRPTPTTPLMSTPLMSTDLKEDRR
ncbi:MAG: SDR family NAD(P)-dependent oxidoreductase [Rhodococcus sp. (in: high G+C Gram-positive bacteria)]|uniref:SDR family NAD(P)-dependent oxidoreductase n=1 Tax=Rhodococcus sp. TaxID=1831 RepID=UPI002ADBE4F2|nr:SDR family NAD(P)-dependent oxidoreductase [Rhodococcus sp. (in: high G+C Gram-positive bacteria)]